MDYICSFFFNVNIYDERQRTFVLKTCSKILSYPFSEPNSSLSLGNEYYGHNRFEIDVLLNAVFKSNHVNVYRSCYSSICIDFKSDTLARVLPICKEWFQPSIKSLKRLDKEKRRSWVQNYNGSHSEERMKNDLINNIDKILPGFNYLVDFEWDVNENYHHYGVGDLIFGSKYGVYISIETKWLNTNSGKSARASRNYARNEVKTQAERYRRLAQDKFMVKVIGASYTNDAENTIQFVNDQDAEIAEIIRFYTNRSSEIWGILSVIFLILMTVGAYLFIVNNKRPYEYIERMYNK